MSTGLAVTPYYDPLLVKVIAWSDSRALAIAKLKDALTPEEIADSGRDSNRIIIRGPPTNMSFLYQALNESVFVEGSATTEWVDRGGVSFNPR